MKHLFIGGPVDGQWIEAEGRPQFRVMLPKEPLARRPDEPINLEESQAVQTVTYTATHWHAGNKRFLIYWAGEDPPDRIMERLLAGYLPSGVRVTLNDVCAGWISALAKYFPNRGAYLLRCFWDILKATGVVNATLILHAPPEAAERMQRDCPDVKE